MTGIPALRGSPTYSTGLFSSRPIRATLVELKTIALLIPLLTLAAPAMAQPLEIEHESIVVEAPFQMPAIRVPVFPERDFPITDFGARSGGDEEKARTTAAIRKAIAACHEAGGGRVVIPPGEWLTGAVHLRSGVNLHVTEGAELHFSDDPADYLPAVRTSWEGMECFNYSPLIYAFDCEDVAITGKGKLRARMGTWRKWFERPDPHMAALARLYQMASTDVPVEERRMAEGDNNLRPQFIQFNRCRRVLVENVDIGHSPFWTIHPLLCEDVVIRGVEIWAHGHNNDGVDPEMTRNLLIEHCTFDQGDDAIAIKAGRNHDAWRLATPTENIVMRHCLIRKGHQLAAIGSELSGGIRNVYIHDCRFVEDGGEGPFNLLFIKTNRRRGGFVENIHFENIRAGRVRESILGIETDVLYQWRDLVPTHEERLTAIRGIHLRDIEVGEVDTPFRIHGDPDRPVEDVRLEKITIGKATRKEGEYEHVDRVREEDIRILEPGS